MPKGEFRPVEASMSIEISGGYLRIHGKHTTAMIYIFEVANAQEIAVRIWMAFQTEEIAVKLHRKSQ